jgi:hypothetical protein
VILWTEPADLCDLSDLLLLLLKLNTRPLLGDGSRSWDPAMFQILLFFLLFFSFSFYFYFSFFSASQLKISKVISGTNIFFFFFFGSVGGF